MALEPLELEPLLEVARGVDVELPLELELLLEVAAGVVVVELEPDPELLLDVAAGVEVVELEPEPELLLDVAIGVEVELELPLELELDVAMVVGATLVDPVTPIPGGVNKAFPWGPSVEATTYITWPVLGSTTNPRTEP